MKLNNLIVNGLISLLHRIAILCAREDRNKQWFLPLKLCCLLLEMSSPEPEMNSKLSLHYGWLTISVEHNLNELTHITGKIQKESWLSLLTSPHVVLHLAEIRREGITHYTNTNTKTGCNHSPFTLGLILICSEQLWEGALQTLNDK